VNKIIVLASLVGLVGLVEGCAEGQTAAGPGTAGSSGTGSPGAGSPGTGTSASLAAPLAVTAQAVADGRVSFTVAGGFAGPTAEQLHVGQATLRLSSTGQRAELEALVLSLEDVDVPARALPPHGLALRQLRLEVGAAALTVEHADDDALQLAGRLPLRLGWSLLLPDGSLFPLGSVETAPVDLEIELVRAGGRTGVTVQAHCAGSCWSVAGVASLSDGTVWLEADAEVTKW
jgi:hypothetical protein